MQSITAHAAGRQLFDAVPDGDDFRLRFVDGLELVIAWASGGPEVRAVHQGVITSERIMHPQFHYVSGKTVKAVYTNGAELIVAFTDGHELRSDFKLKAPEVRAVDVKIELTAVNSIGVASL